MAGDLAGPPSGTVTFLFTDVVGSTRLWATDPDAMSASLRIHDEVMQRAFAEFDGYVFATAGDSFATAFSRASEAVACASALQSALAEANWGGSPALGVRIGLHLGEAEERAGNYFGSVVNQAARVMSVAHGGQVVVTDAVRDASSVDAVDLGTHVLRDIEAPVHLSQVGDGEFPPLRTVPQGIVSLPSPRTSLVGREEAVRDVRKFLATHRLVTLTGVGGCGKTRLAIEVATRETPSHPDGVWFVDLSTITDEDALSGLFAATLSLGVTSDRPVLDQVVTYLTPREGLLVVDNCEHVIDSAAEVIDSLLERCPDLRIIATSRESLEIDGEFTWKIPSLDADDGGPAVQLFVDRAEAAGAHAIDDPGAAATIAEITRRLDGIPLAIELAAARTPTMSVEEIRSRLDDRFLLLSGGSRRGRQRQTTLEDTVTWSYDLLSGPEQQLLQVLSVFQGGFDPSDVAGVADLSEYEARDLIDSLHGKSLVDTTRGVDGTIRHRLLETIRLFAQVRLFEAGRTEEVRNRHLEHFFAITGDGSLEHYLEREVLDYLGREYENVRSVIVWAMESGWPDRAVQLARLALSHAFERGEAEFVVNVLRHPVELDPADEAARLAVLAFALITAGDPVAAIEVNERALRLTADTGCDSFLLSLVVKGGIDVQVAGLRVGTEVFLEAQRWATEHAGPNCRALIDFQVAAAWSQALRFWEAIELFRQGLALNARASSRGIAEAYLAWCLLAVGEIEEADRITATWHDRSIPGMFSHTVKIADHVLMAARGDPEEAGRSLAASIREDVARRASIRSDVLVAFAYIDQLCGDVDHAQELVRRVNPFFSYGIWCWMILEADGAVDGDVYDRLDQFIEAHSVFERAQYMADHGASLMEDEFRRWQ